MHLLFALSVLVLAAGWRVLAVQIPALANFAPLMALTFCGAVYLRDRRLWVVPFLALVVSDVYLDSYYAATFQEGWTWPSVAIRAACFACALPLGRLVAQRKNMFTLAAGTLAGSLLFYVATNTDAWFRDVYYAKTLAGWLQALTFGRPEFPPTLFFFRNTLVSDLLFTGAFAAAMELARRKTTVAARA
ncbi:MAG: DUF6580 family putative transport protein [Verrucomicrobiota bacterium]|jgi:hypothetical protein